MASDIIDIGKAGYFSASGVANLYGCGYGTPLDVHNRYKGIDQNKEVSEEAQKSMDFGTLFEDAVAQYFMHVTGLKVKKMGNGHTAYFRRDMPYFICHPDRLGIGKDLKGRRFALEIKCVSPYSEGWGDEYTEQVPDRFYIQCQCYFATGVPCDVVYLASMRGNRVYIYEILPDEDVIDDIRGRVKAAKESYDNGIVPDPVNFDEAITQYAKSVKETLNGIPAGDEGLSIWKDLVDNHEALKEAESREKELKTKMIVFMGDHPSVITAEGKKIKVLAKYSETRRKVFDENLFSIEMPNIYEKYLSEKVTRSVRFSFPRSKKENQDGND